MTAGLLELTDAITGIATKYPEKLIVENLDIAGFANFGAVYLYARHYSADRLNLVPTQEPARKRA
ncbi:MAG: hypothetical protein WA419_22790, partial [Silvibacterium sp.]